MFIRKDVVFFIYLFIHFLFVIKMFPRFIWLQVGNKCKNVLQHNSKGRTTAAKTSEEMTNSRRFSRTS